MSKVLTAGGTGSIGTDLARYMLEQGDVSVRVFDDVKHTIRSHEFGRRL